MTCVVAIIADGKTYMGADSLGIAGYSSEIRAHKKIFYNGEFLIGGTLSFRMLDILQYSFVPPVIDPNIDDLRRYMCTSFIARLRETLSTDGFDIKADDSNQDNVGTTLVAIRDRLFTIGGDFQVGENVEPYAAVGHGQDVAIGSLFSTHDLEPEDRIQVALEAAEQFSAGVGRPFHILSTKP